jgi:predicted RNA-binding Zn ribbon-like protein
VTAPRPILRYDDGGWAEAIGNHVALDLVNTVAWRPDPARTVDRIPDGAALTRWARFVGLLGDDAESIPNEVAARVRKLREQVYRVVRPMAVGEEPADADVESLHRFLLGVLGRAEVASVMPLELSAADLPDELGLAAWRLLEREDAGRIRQCRAGDCGWLFLDRTKNGSRVWCSSADCGNRTRARRHYARRTAERR